MFFLVFLILNILNFFLALSGVFCHALAARWKAVQVAESQEGN
jgi:hypothetical protein